MATQKTKTKTHTFWCVVGVNPFMFTARLQRETSIESFISNSNMNDWSEAKKIGYTCQKFTITTKVK